MCEVYNYNYFTKICELTHICKLITVVICYFCNYTNVYTHSTLYFVYNICLYSLFKAYIHIILSMNLIKS
ncbi:hypothetical protein Palpr_0739 [Paludibacter propionicigenes WB4]|uniref:Uncharacterized protein n=1 Tax=Paludibacter propionicigenes (strain DSM 17365 / JCM 13257 / WB4) TaxID=694427 RepID=E4T2F1_PALPW|nr:hypothetical protein Palpr_0739 [Paludibacter propionicigenes WB4]